MGRPKETISLEDKFWYFVDVKGEDDCWEWTGTLYRQGYGRFYHRDTVEVKSHRVSFLINFGEIPLDSLIYHKCNNRKCVNPKHIYAGSITSNMEDLSSSGVLKGEKNSQAKLTEELVIKIREEYFHTFENTRSLAKRYNVSQPLISKIVRGISWSHVEGPTGKQVSDYVWVSPQDRMDIKNLRSTVSSVREISVKYNRCESTIRRILKRKVSV